MNNTLGEHIKNLKSIMRNIIGNKMGTRWEHKKKNKK
jgi:hypothetical protein